MADLARLLHDISLAFATSSHLRTLMPRLSEIMGNTLPVVELEAVFLDMEREQAFIRVLAPEFGRGWQGQRSARFFTRQCPDTAMWVEDHEAARVASTPIESQLVIPFGTSGLLRISFARARSELMGEARHTDMLVELLSTQARRLAQLDSLARHTRELHRQIGEHEQAQTEPEAVEEAHRNTEEVQQTSAKDPLEETAVAPSHQAELPLRMPQHPPTEIRVKTLDVALTECITKALRATRGRIYGDGGAAELLGLKPSTLQSKMRKLGIERRTFAS